MKKLALATMMIFMTAAAQAEYYRTASGRVKWRDLGPSSNNRYVESTPKSEDSNLIITPYASLRAGFAQVSIDSFNGFDNGASGAVALGLKFKLNDRFNIRFEGEAVYNLYRGGPFEMYPGTWSAFIYNIETSQRVFMANFYIDFLTDQIIKPYLGFGVGAMNIAADIEVIQGGFLDQRLSQSGSLTTGFYGGFGFNITSDGSAIGDVGVRYLNAQVLGLTVSSISYNLGVRFRL